MKRPRQAANSSAWPVGQHRIADRHEVTVTKLDGTTTRIEVYLFAELADNGRLRRVDEITRLVAGDGNGADLAQVR